MCCAAQIPKGAGAAGQGCTLRGIAVGGRSPRALGVFSGPALQRSKAVFLPPVLPLTGEAQSPRSCLGSQLK